MQNELLRNIPMKTTFNLSHFGAQNTPKLAQLLGDAGLILATISGIPLILQQYGLVVSPQIATIATWAMAGGSIVKLISKTFGVTDENGTPVNPNPETTVSTPSQPTKTN